LGGGNSRERGGAIATPGPFRFGDPWPTGAAQVFVPNGSNAAPESHLASWRVRSITIARIIVVPSRGSGRRARTDHVKP